MSGAPPPSLALVHLVRAANGYAPVLRFLEAYREHAAGVSHDLVIVCKGMVDALELQWFSSFWRELVLDRCRVVTVPDDGPNGSDLRTYDVVASELETDYVCFLNSFSRPRVSGWLERLYSVAVRPEVGLAGATGSHEIEPHVRTNAFCMRRERFITMLTPPPEDRAAALRLEVGAASLTNRVRGLGLEARVVSREADVDVMDAASLTRARVFRWGLQEGLLVADNRTDQYASADEGTRADLERMTWQGRTWESTWAGLGAAES